MSADKDRVADPRQIFVLLLLLLLLSLLLDRKGCVCDLILLSIPAVE